MFSFTQIRTFLDEGESRILSGVETPDNLYNPIRYILSLGGKKIRPALVLLSCNVFSDDLDAALAPALGIEIFHNFTLMHDDLMDRSDMRRGNLTVHKKWNDNTAILSGDAMLALAYQYISKCKPDLLPDVLNLFSTTAREVCEGQQYDMDFEPRSDVSENEYLEMIRLKTAVLLGCALKLGAIIGNANSEDAQNLYDFGINLGLAFQLKDDLLDVYGDSSVFGKNIGGDIVCNKKTFLLIKALEKAAAEQKSILQYWLSLSLFDKEEKIKNVTDIYNRLHIQELCEEKIAFYCENAMKCLRNVHVTDERKHELILLAQSLSERRY